MLTSSTEVRPRLPVLGRYFETSLYLLLLVSVLTLVSTGKLDLVSIFAPPAALLLKGYRWWRGRAPELSHRAATWLVLGYFFFFPLDLFWLSRVLAADAQNPALYSALLASIHLMLFAMIVRLFSARTTRDYLFLALLAFSAMLASAILTVDTAFLVFFLVFLALCVSTFMGLEMRRSAEASSSPPLTPEPPAARRMHAALGIASGAIAVSALLVGTGIFFLLPRFSAGYLSGFNLQPSLISGFTDDVELGEIGEIKQSSALVMRIKVDEGAVMARDVRWRGIALTTFDGRRWYSEAHEPAAVSLGPDGWIALAGKVSDEIEPPVTRFSIPMHYTVFLEPMASDAIFVAAAPVRIRGQFMGESLPGGRAARNTYLVLDKTGSLANPFHNFANVRYDAVSALAARASPTSCATIPRIYSPAVRDLYLQLPRLDPRIPALATQAAGRARNPYDQARAVEQFLRSHYAYTLDLSGPPQSDPLAHFLFERRAGHCEYFAAAMTVMMRSLGVPARYINGFLPGEYNDLGGDFIVRARDAHSWVEVFFPGYGWMTFDPTPPSEEHITGVMSQLGLYWDWFQLQWGEWVINYDFFHQLTLAQNLQRNSRNWTQQLRGKFDSARNAGAERVRRWQARLAATPRWFLALLALLFAATFALSIPAPREWLFRGRLGEWLAGLALGLAPALAARSAPSANRGAFLSPHAAHARAARLAQGSFADSARICRVPAGRRGSRAGFAAHRSVPGGALRPSRCRHRPWRSGRCGALCRACWLACRWRCASAAKFKSVCRGFHPCSPQAFSFALTRDVFHPLTARLFHSRFRTRHYSPPFRACFLRRSALAATFSIPLAASFLIRAHRDVFSPRLPRGMLPLWFRRKSQQDVAGSASSKDVS